MFGPPQVACLENRIKCIYGIRHVPCFQAGLDIGIRKNAGLIHGTGIPTKCKTAEDMFLWWMEKEQIDGQVSLADFEDWRIRNG